MANQHRPSPIRLLDGDGGAAYDEETFRYFLALEQARAARTSQPLRVLLATLEQAPGQRVSFPRAAAPRIMSTLRHALRDTDVVGWYVKDRVAAAVLTAAQGDSPPQIALLERRVAEGLRAEMSAQVAGMLRVRVVRRDFSAPARARGTA